MNQGQTIATHIAHKTSEPFNLLGGYSPILPLNIGDGHSSVDHLIDPLLTDDPHFGSSTNYHRDEAVAKTSVEDPIHPCNVAWIPGVPEHAARSHPVGTNSTLDGGPEEMTTLALSRQQALRNIGLGGPAYAGNSGVFRPELRRSVHQVGHLNAPETFTQGRNATSPHTNALHTSTQLVSTPGQPALQNAPVDQPYTIQDTFSHAGLHATHGAHLTSPSQYLAPG